MEPGHVAIRTSFISPNGPLLPILLALDPGVSILEPKTLNIFNQRAYLFLPQIPEGRHQ